MSTKITVKHGPQYHVYEECLDEGHIYLKLDGMQFVAASAVEFEFPPSVTVQIPRPIAEALGLIKGA